MISIKKTDGNTLITLNDIECGSWVHLQNPNDDELNYVCKKTGIAENLLISALDDEERAHINIERKNVRLLVIDIPYNEDDGRWDIYNTIPLGVIFNDNYFITVCLDSNNLINDFLNDRIKNVDTANHSQFMLLIFNATAQNYLQYLRNIDKTNMRIQAGLYKSLKNKELLQLLDLEKSLVYFSTSLRANTNVLNKALKFIKVNDESFIEDIKLEYSQAIEMCNIYRDIMSGTMDAFASIISNNINVVMKMLTIVTIILTMPTIFASLWGMNVALPFAHNPAGFWIILGIITLITVVVSVAIVLISRTFGMRK